MDVPLHKHLVKRLPVEEQIELLHQLATDQKDEELLGHEFPFEDELFESSTKTKIPKT